MEGGQIARQEQEGSWRPPHHAHDIYIIFVNLFLLITIGTETQEDCKGSTQEQEGPCRPSHHVPDCITVTNLFDYCSQGGRYYWHCKTATVMGMQHEHTDKQKASLPLEALDSTQKQEGSRRHSHSHSDTLSVFHSARQQKHSNNNEYLIQRHTM